MELVEIAAALSVVFPSPRTSAAANAVLAMEQPGAALGRLYTFLVWQRTLRIALGHLEAAGAALDELEIPERVVRQTFPRGYRPVFDVGLPPPVTARDLIEVFARHRTLLAGSVLPLTDAGLDRFALVSGRAYEVRYPSYAHRAEFDTDLVVPDHAAAAQVASVLTAAGFSLDTVRVNGVGKTADGVVEIRRSIEGHLVSVGVLVGGYHAYRAPIAARAEIVSREGRSTPVARPADMLVMLAARVERKRRFALVNFNDAAVILDRDAASIDWDEVCAMARTARLNITLRVVLDRAQRIVGRQVVPAHVAGRLVRSKAEHVQLNLASGVAAECVALGSGHGFDPPDTRTRRTWLAANRIRQQRRPDAPSVASQLVLKLQRRVLSTQLARARAGRLQGRTGTVLARLRTRSGAFCELAPHLAATERCISSLGPWRGPASVAGSMAAIARGYERPPGGHDCGRLRFELSDA